jgi:hypothetical protein
MQRFGESESGRSKRDQWHVSCSKVARFSAKGSERLRVPGCADRFRRFRTSAAHANAIIARWPRKHRWQQWR